MKKTHKTSRDKGYSFHSGIVVAHKCPKCEMEISNYSNASIRCPACESKGNFVWMKTHKVIGEKKTDEIRNRVVEKTEYKPSPYSDLWEEGLVKKIQEKIYPISGEGKLTIEAKNNKEMWLDKVIKINNGYYRLYDLSKVLLEATQ